MAHAAEVKEQESASAPTQSSADEYYEVEPTPVPATASSSKSPATSLQETAMRSGVDKCSDALYPFACASALF